MGIRLAAILSALLLISCASIFHPKWAGLIRRHDASRYSYASTTLRGVDIPAEVFARPASDVYGTPCETYDVLDSIKPGGSDYRIVFKNYLGEGAEGEPSEIIEYVLFRLEGDSISAAKSVFVHDWNEMPHKCFWLDSVTMGPAKVRFKGVMQHARAIDKTIDFVVKDSMTLSDIRAERARFRKLGRDARR